MNEDLLEELKTVMSALEKSSNELNIRIKDKDALLDEKLQAVSAVLKRADKKEKMLNEMISNLEKTLSSFNSRIEEIENNIKDVLLKADNLKSDADRIEQKMYIYTDIQARAENAQKAIESFNKDTSKIHSDIVNLSEDASVCNTAYKTMKKSFDKMNKEINAFMSADLGKLVLKDDATVKRNFAQYVKDHLIPEINAFEPNRLKWK